MLAVILRRNITATYTRLLKLPKSSFFLLGPRGTGKTTWVRRLLPRAKVFDLLDESLFQSYLADISLFSREETKIALEVKASVKLREEHFRGLRAIHGLPGLKRRLLVYLGGALQRTTDGIEVWPVDKLWRTLATRGTLGS